MRHWRKNVGLLGVLAVVPLLFAACGNLSTSPSLTKTTWELDKLNGSSALENVVVTMRLADEGALYGSGGCNRFIGSWEQGDGSTLTLTPSGTTLMACDEPIANQETAFLAALSSTVSYRLDDDELELRDAGGTVVAEFDQLDAARLTRTRWEAVSLNNGQQAMVGLVDGSEITAIFGTNDTLTGNGGCNTYSTAFSVDGETMTISAEIVSTRMACEQPIMDQEAMFMALLPQAATYELGDDTLYLRDSNGALLVMFQERDDD